MTSDFVRYLEAKRSVDDRAMDLRVWQQLGRELRARGPDVRLLDVGAGTGTGLRRMIDWGLFEGLSVRYVALEPDAALARHYPKADSDSDSDSLAVHVVAQSLERAETGELEPPFDLVVAHAVLDILELGPSLDRLVALTAEAGLLYFPITFDGETIWEPSHPDDEGVMVAYHGTMKRRGRTGRLLPHALERRGLEILETAGSDWIVRASGGDYPEDERYFLEFLLETVRGAVDGRTDPARSKSWLDERHRQLERGELVLIAHQLDVLAKRR